MKLYTNDDIDFVKDKTCCSLDDVEDAKSVAARLGALHCTLNMTEDFRIQISGCSAVLVARLNGVQEAVSSILATRTINPTISR